MSEKILPMKHPVITSYPMHANVLSCVSRYEESMAWFYNYYIQVFAGKDLSRACYADFSVPAPWKCCPWIHFQRLNRELVESKWETFTQFVIDSLENGYYVYTYLDQYYVPCSYAYNQLHYAHDNFIFGYERSGQTFHVADFFRAGKYGFATAARTGIEDAFRFLDLSGTVDNLQGVVLMKPVDYKGYRFHKKVVVELLNDFLLSRNNSRNYTDGYRLDIGAENDLWVFGLEVYTLIREYLEVSLQGSGEEELDIRGLQVLADHKTMMLLRIRYLYENKHLCDLSVCEDYEKTRSRIISLRNMVIKSMLSQDKNIVRDAIELVPAIQHDEKVSAEKLLEQLS